MDRQGLIEIVDELEDARFELIQALAEGGRMMQQIRKSLVRDVSILKLLDSRSRASRDSVFDALFRLNTCVARVRGAFYAVAVTEGATLHELSMRSGLTRQTIAGLIRRLPAQ